MEHTALAERFNEVGRSLDREGYRAVIRRARQLLEAGSADEAVALLARAREVLENRGEPVGALAEALRGWLGAGGDPAALVIDPVWVEGSAAESRPRRLLEAATRGNVGELVASLVAQKQAQSRGEALPRAPEAVVPKSALPPLPRLDKVAAAAEDATRAEVARIFPEGARRPRAAVEAPSQLTERPLRLDEADEGLAALEKETAARPPLPPPPPVPPVEAAEDDFAPEIPLDEPAPAVPETRRATPEAPPLRPVPPSLAAPKAAPPELERPPEMSVPATAPKKGKGGLIAAAVALLAAGAAVGWYFLSR